MKICCVCLNSPVEAEQYSFCKDCWWEQDPRNTNPKGRKMNPSDFIKACVMREAKDIQPIKDRLQSTENVRLLHAMIGMCTEAGEIQDQMKKAIFYGKVLDKTNLVEELGDVMWYIAVACDTLGVSLEEVMAKNNAKLEARYGKVFTETAALNRDLTKERDILEKK